MAVRLKSYESGWSGQAGCQGSPQAAYQPGLEALRAFTQALPERVSVYLFIYKKYLWREALLVLSTNLTRGPQVHIMI